MSSTGQENAAYQRTEAEEGGGGAESNKTEDAVTENKEEEETEYKYVAPVYAERTVITVQPHGNEGTNGVRYPLPVAPVSWVGSTNFGNFIPLTGLQFLVGVEQVNIQQTVELDDLLSNVESENRYVLKNGAGETIYVGAESSSTWQRMICGSGRSFKMKLFDPTRQEAFNLVRRMACHTGLCGCYLQRLDVFTPSGGFIGCVEQMWTPFIPSFIVKDSNRTELYRMVGPRVCACSMYTEATFQVYDASTQTQIASISHSWENTLVNYNLKLTFPSQYLENTHKALLIGAAFLLEYLFFETAKKKRCGCCPRRETTSL